MPSVRTFLCDPSMAAVHQIRALGLNLRDVRHIGMTHMDLDHIGGLSDSRTRKTALIPPAGPEASEI